MHEKKKFIQKFIFWESEKFKKKTPRCDATQRNGWLFFESQFDKSFTKKHFQVSFSKMIYRILHYENTNKVFWN
jgi:hypothetical protein